MPYSPDRANVTLDASNQSGINYDYTRDVVVSAIGEARLSIMDTMHRPTLEHGLGTGEMVADILGINDYPDTVVELGALAGGTHDVGKNRDDLLAWITYEGDYGHEVRRWVTSEHSKEGGNRLRAWRTNGGDSRLRYAAFSADNHHQDVPEDYAEYTSGLKIAWGLTHLIKACDVLNALACDTSRAYVKKREGKVLAPEDIYRIVQKAKGPTPITLLGREVEVDFYVRYVLDLAHDQVID